MESGVLVVGIGSTHHFSLQNTNFEIGLPANFPRSVSQRSDDFALPTCRAVRGRAGVSPAATR
jgi:hypothetical protein